MHKMQTTYCDQCFWGMVSPSPFTVRGRGGENVASCTIYKDMPVPTHLYLPDGTTFNVAIIKSLQPVLFLSLWISLMLFMTICHCSVLLWSYGLLLLKNYYKSHPYLSRWHCTCICVVMPYLFICSLLKYVMCSTGAVSKTKASVSDNPYFPTTTYVFFEQRNLQQIFGRQVYLHILHSNIGLCETSIIFWLALIVICTSSFGSNLICFLFSNYYDCNYNNYQYLHSLCQTNRIH